MCGARHQTVSRACFSHACVSRGVKSTEVRKTLLKRETEGKIGEKTGKSSGIFQAVDFPSYFFFWRMKKNFYCTCLLGKPRNPILSRGNLRFPAEDVHLLKTMLQLIKISFPRSLGQKPFFIALTGNNPVFYFQDATLAGCCQGLFCLVFFRSSTSFRFSSTEN